MYVIYKEVKGELVSNGKHVTFVPDEEPYGKNRITISMPEICIMSEDDEDCIWVMGFVQANHIGERAWIRDNWSFYPIPREAKKKN